MSTHIDALLKNGGMFTCPACGCPVHIEKASVFVNGDKVVEVDTQREDQHHNVTIKREDVKNPSPWEHAVTIQFWCEGGECNQISELRIYPHEGGAYINWRKVGERYQT